MTALCQEMQFTCYQCEGRTTVRVHCQGEGLGAGPRALAACVVPCFHCGAASQLYFHPVSGDVAAVEPTEASRARPVPSVN